MAGVFGGLVALTGAALTGNLGSTTTVVMRDALPPAEAAVTTPSAAVTPSDGASPPEAAAPSMQSVLARSSPAVVKISEGRDSDLVGSGFLVRGDGLMLTNAHVVGESETVWATFEDGTETEATVLGRDDSTDLAVLRAGEVPDGVRPLDLGSSRSLTVGDPVIAIGNPFGLERTATAGIVSALKRIIRAPNGFEIQNVVQTDAAINRGSSGGPLLDASGRVVGVNTQIATGSGGNDGVGFVVPVDTLRPIVNAIVRTGEPEHAWLGVTGRTITPAMARELGHPAVRGVALLSVDERGPAHRAGLRPATTPLDAEVPRGGDLVVAAGGEPVTDMAEVSRAVSSRAVGDPLRLAVLRDGQRVELTVPLAERPDDVGLAPRP